MVRPLRWLLLATHVPEQGQLGGIVRYTVELAQALDARSDVDLTVVCTPAAKPFFTRLLSSRQVRTVPALPLLITSVVERYGGFLLAPGESFDVVQGAKHLVPVRARALRLLTVHDMLVFDRPQDQGLAKRTLLRAPYLASLRSADVLACVSAATRARLLEQVPEIADRADVVPLAMSTALREVAPAPVPELVGRPFALVVGDPSPRKNLGMVVDAWEQVVARVPDAVLALAGPQAWAASEHGDSFERLRREGSLVALGRVSDDRLRWCYSTAAVVLCPSLLEGFGLPALEALGFGAPLITSTDAALCEASGDAATHLPADRPGLWVDAIVRAVSAAPSRREPRAVRTWDEVADDTVSSARRRLLAGT